eukprot:jgi/Hompol1/6078/HPOL_002210-RA
MVDVAERPVPDTTALSDAWRKTYVLTAKRRHTPLLDSCHTTVTDASKWSTSLSVIDGTPFFAVGSGAKTNNFFVLENTAINKLAASDSYSPPKDAIIVKSAFSLPCPIFHMSIQGDMLVTAGPDGLAQIYKVEVADLGQKGKGFTHVHECLIGFAKVKAQLISPPGSIIQSVRLTHVELEPTSSITTSSSTASSTIRKLLAVQAKRVYLYDLPTDRILGVEQPNSDNLHTATFSPHSSAANIVATGGLDMSLSLLDSRLMSATSAKGHLASMPSQSTVWSCKNAHEDAVVDIKFNTFVPYWIATSGADGVVKVWDIRYNAGPAARIDGHFASVTSIAWSNTHCDVITSGSADRAWRAWAINSDQLSASTPSQDTFIGFPNAASNLSFGGPRHAVLGAKIIGEHQTDYTTPIVSVVASTQHADTFLTLSASGEVISHTIRDELFEQLAPHRYEEVAAREVETKVFCRNLTQAYESLVKYTRVERASGMEADPGFLDRDTLQYLVEEVITRSYLKGLSMGLRFGEIIADTPRSRFDQLASMMGLLLFPTVYDAIEWLPDAENTLAHQQPAMRQTAITDFIAKLRKMRAVTEQLEANASAAGDAKEGLTGSDTAALQIGTGQAGSAVESRPPALMTRMTPHATGMRGLLRRPSSTSSSQATRLRVSTASTNMQQPTTTQSNSSDATPGAKPQSQTLNGVNVTAGPKKRSASTGQKALDRFIEAYDRRQTFITKSSSESKQILPMVSLEIRLAKLIEKQADTIDEDIVGAMQQNVLTDSGVSGVRARGTSISTHVGGGPTIVPFERTISATANKLYLDSLLATKRFDDFFGSCFDLISVGSCLNNEASLLGTDFSKIVFKLVEEDGMNKLKQHLDGLFLTATNHLQSIFQNNTSNSAMPQPVGPMAVAQASKGLIQGSKLIRDAIVVLVRVVAHMMLGLEVLGNKNEKSMVESLMKMMTTQTTMMLQLSSLLLRTFDHFDKSLANKARPTQSSEKAATGHTIHEEIFSILDKLYQAQAADRILSAVASPEGIIVAAFTVAVDTIKTLVERQPALRQKIQDTERRIEDMFDRLAGHKIDRVVLAKLVQLAQALDAKDLASAQSMVMKMMTSNHADETAWILGAKRLVEMLQSV